MSPGTASPRTAAGALAWKVVAPRALAPAAVLVAAGERGVRRVVLLPSREPATLRASLDRLGIGRPIGAPSPLARERLRDAVSELEAYFAGSAEPFRIPCDLEGRGAPFDARVWAAARGIPFGSVASYGEVAARLDLPRAARAVGRALSRNPLAIFIPCHRVVGADGSLVGFSSGLSQKAALLWHEGVRLEGGPGRWRVARAGLARASRPRRAPESAARGGGGRPPDFEDRHP